MTHTDTLHKHPHTHVCTHLQYMHTYTHLHLTAQLQQIIKLNDLTAGQYVETLSFAPFLHS